MFLFAHIGAFFQGCVTKYRFFKSFGTEIAKVRALPGGSVGFRTVRRKMCEFWRVAKLRGKNDDPGIRTASGGRLCLVAFENCPRPGQGAVVQEVIEAESTRLIFARF